MAVYNMRSKAGPGSVTHAQECLPTKQAMELFYEAGGLLYKDDVKLTLSEAKAECLQSEPGEAERARKSKKK